MRARPISDYPMEGTMMQRTVSLDSRGTGRVLVALVGMLAAFTLLSGAQRALANHGGAHDTTGWIFFKSVTPQPACTPGLGDVRYWNRRDCGTVRVDIGNTAAGNTTKLAFFGPSGAQLGPTENGTRSSAGLWNFNVTPSATWEAGVITARVVEVNGQSGNFGETQFFHNLLGAKVSAGDATFQPGDPVPITGRLFELWHKPSALIEPPTEIDVAGTFFLRAVWPDGTTRGPYSPFTANAGGVPGAISATLPGSATTGLTAGQDTGFRATVAVEVVNAAYTDPSTGAWAAQRAGAAPAKFAHEPNALVLENSFVSSVGWVQPGAAYPFRVFVRNYTASSVSGARVTIPAPDGTTFTGVTTLSASDTASISGGTITWTLGTVPAAVGGVPAIKTLVVQARTDTLGLDPQIVWKDLSSTATLSYGSTTITSRSRGPKVIPPGVQYETARYGYRPFAVVPADYFDRKHKAVHTGDALSDKVNSPDVPGSTFNLYQEMSYGQLFPNGTVPSSGLASAGWNVEWKSDRHRQRGFQFTTPVTQGACYGTSFKDHKGSALYPERIRDGWYQLPGDTGYYGGDTTSFANLAAPEIQFIDSACGPISKSVYDAAHIADPEIDYSDYDTDKDGVVDFFMLVFVGLGGNGASQGLTADPDAVPPYDNIWPHSFSLEAQYTDPETGLKGYISDDQLKDLQGRPLYYTDSSRQQMTAQETAFPVYVRVGPYNVNPESAIDQASVISHEYGHSLGLPDFYSSPGSGRSTLGDWNLMATDKSQHMDVFSKQELGWLVPRVLKPGTSVRADGWRDSKVDTHRIDWVDPNGNPYTLQGPRVHNGEAYVAKL